MRCLLFCKRSPGKSVLTSTKSRITCEISPRARDDDHNPRWVDLVHPRTVRTDAGSSSVSCSRTRHNASTRHRCISRRRCERASDHVLLSDTHHRCKNHRISCHTSSRNEGIVCSEPSLGDVICFVERDLSDVSVRMRTRSEVIIEDV